MNNAEIKLHQTMLRLAKGMLKAYGDWLEEETVTAMAEQLKQARQQQHGDPRLRKIDFSGVKE